MAEVTVAALYHFFPVEDPAAWCARLQGEMDSRGIKGSLLVAPEGLNGTVAGAHTAIEELISVLQAMPGVGQLDYKLSRCAENPFLRAKAKLKKEIVTMGDSEIDPRTRVGTYVDPEQWDALLNDPDVVVVDTRNRYETRLGMFPGAIDPDITTFRDFPDWVADNLDPNEQPKVAMYCTGGIRCEKATSLLLRQGFKEVYHLRGGILRYMEKTEKSESQWSGDCFVFDQRVALQHDLSPSDHELCFSCQEPLTKEDRDDPRFELGVSCPYCADKLTETQRASRRERAKQTLLAEKRGQKHIGDTARRRTSRKKAEPPDTTPVTTPVFLSAEPGAVQQDKRQLPTVASSKG